MVAERRRTARSARAARSAGRAKRERAGARARHHGRDAGGGADRRDAGARSRFPVDRHQRPHANMRWRWIAAIRRSRPGSTALHPAVLRLIDATVRGRRGARPLDRRVRRARRRSAGGADPDRAGRHRTCRCRAAAVAEIKALVRTLDLAPVPRRSPREALAAPDAAAVRALVAPFLEETPHEASRSQSLQPLGRALMLPIAVLPIAGLLLRLGQPDLLDIAVRRGGGRGDLRQSRPAVRARRRASGFARDNNGAAGLAGSGLLPRRDRGRADAADRAARHRRRHAPRTPPRSPRRRGARRRSPSCRCRSASSPG